jgi:hypothetical protein
MINQWLDATIISNGHKTKFFYSRMDNRQIKLGDIFYISDNDEIFEAYIKKIISGKYFLTLFQRNPISLINGPSLVNKI